MFIGWELSWELCSPFEFSNSGLRQLRASVQIMCVQDRANVTQTVSGDCRDFSDGASRDCETCDGCAPQIVKRHASDARFFASLAP